MSFSLFPSVFNVFKMVFHCFPCQCQSLGRFLGLFKNGGYLVLYLQKSTEWELSGEIHDTSLYFMGFSGAPFSDPIWTAIAHGSLQCQVEYEAIEEKPKIVYGKPSMSLVDCISLPKSLHRLIEKGQMLIRKALL